MTTPTVVLVHGIRASGSMWARQLAALRDAGVPALAVDLPGHGARRSQHFTVPSAVDVIDEAASAVDGPVVVVGLSMGGYMALHWAARARRRPAALVAASCCTQPQGLGLAAYRAVARLIGRLPDGGATLNDVVARRVVPEEAREDLAVGGMTVAVMAEALAGMAAVNTLADLAAVPEPVWLVNGRWDHFRGHERRFLAACQDGRLVIVPRATHLVSLTRPVAFSRILLEVVDEVAAAAGEPAPRRAVPRGTALEARQAVVRHSRAVA